MFGGSLHRQVGEEVTICTVVTMRGVLLGPASSLSLQVAHIGTGDLVLC